MASFTSRIRSRTEAFVADLDTLVRRAALAAVGDSLASLESLRGARVRIKRRREQLAELTERIERHVQEHPGTGVEAMGRALAVPSKDLALPIKRLLDERRLVKEGEKRSTRYFPGGDSAGVASRTTTRTRRAGPRLRKAGKTRAGEGGAREGRAPGGGAGSAQAGALGTAVTDASPAEAAGPAAAEGERGADGDDARLRVAL